MQRKFIKITLRHGCSPVNLLHIFRTSAYKNTYRGLLLIFTMHWIFQARKKGPWDRYQSTIKTEIAIFLKSFESNIYAFHLKASDRNIISSNKILLIRCCWPVNCRELAFFADLISMNIYHKVSDFCKG